MYIVLGYATRCASFTSCCKHCSVHLIYGLHGPGLGLLLEAIMVLVEEGRVGLQAGTVLYGFPAEIWRHAGGGTADHSLR